MGRVISGLLGGAKAPTVSPAPIVQTEEEKRKAKGNRAALYETQGGVTGEELNTDQVAKRRQTLLGN